MSYHPCHSPVDPHKSSGQNLWRQYAGKKGKLVLNSHWIHECVKAGQLQTFHTNWAGCKVTGTEQYVLPYRYMLVSFPYEVPGSHHRKRYNQPPPPPLHPQ